MLHAACRQPPNPPVWTARHRAIRYTGKRHSGKCTIDGAEVRDWCGVPTTLAMIPAATLWPCPSMVRPTGSRGRCASIGPIGVAARWSSRAGGADRPEAADGSRPGNVRISHRCVGVRCERRLAYE